MPSMTSYQAGDLILVDFLREGKTSQDSPFYASVRRFQGQLAEQSVDGQGRPPGVSGPWLDVAISELADAIFTGPQTLAGHTEGNLGEIAGTFDSVTGGLTARQCLVVPGVIPHLAKRLGELVHVLLGAKQHGVMQDHGPVVSPVAFLQRPRGEARGRTPHVRGLETSV